jgi:hypothetical protein
MEKLSGSEDSAVVVSRGVREGRIGRSSVDYEPFIAFGGDDSGVCCVGLASGDGT